MWSICAQVVFGSVDPASLRIYGPLRTDSVRWRSVENGSGPLAVRWEHPLKMNGKIHYKITFFSWRFAPNGLGSVDADALRFSNLPAYGNLCTYASTMLPHSKFLRAPVVFDHTSSFEIPTNFVSSLSS